MVRGQINFLVGIFQRLEAAGHDVACVAPTGAENGAAIVAQIVAAGVRVRWIPHTPNGPTRGSPAGRASLTRTLDPADELRWYRARVERALHAARIGEVRDAIRAFAPDVVCVDSLMYSGAVGAELEGVPWVCLTPTLMSVLPPDWRSRQLDLANETVPHVLSLMRRYGASEVGMRNADLVSPWLNLMFNTEALLPRAGTNNTHTWYVGPSRPLGSRGDDPPFEWERLRRDVPIVYASGGGGHGMSYDVETFERMATSLGGDEAQFVCVLHDLVDHPRARALPANVIAVRYAPQLRLFEHHVSAVITHGGMNTTIEALTYGRPLLVVPLGYEQDLVARVVEERGAGLALALERVSPESCRAALRRLLGEPSFAAAAARIGASYAASDGAAHAVSLILELAERRVPMPPPVGGNGG